MQLIGQLRQEDRYNYHSGQVKRLTTRDLQSNLEDSIRALCLHVAPSFLRPCSNRSFQRISEVVTDMAGPTGLLHVHLDLDVMDPSAFPHVMLG